MNKKIVIGIVGVVIAIIAVSVVIMTQPKDKLSFWAEIGESQMILYIRNEGKEEVVLLHVRFPEWGIRSCWMEGETELARIQPHTTLAYEVFHDNPYWCEQFASDEDLLIRIITEKGTYDTRIK